MAHSKSTVAKARAAYIHDNLPLEQISALLGVPPATLERWKRRARADGDD